MMGASHPQPEMFSNISLEGFVPHDHPLRCIRPLIDVKKLRATCAPRYSLIGRPSIPPEQLFLALVAGYVLGIPSERKLVMELQCDMAVRWFVGLGIDEEVWDASTFSQNRRRRFDGSGVLEKLFDETVHRAFAEKLISLHVSADGTLVRANASSKSFVPREVAMGGEEYKKKLREEDREDERPKGDLDRGNPTASFRCFQQKPEGGLPFTLSASAAR